MRAQVEEAESSLVHSFSTAYRRGRLAPSAVSGRTLYR